ncbi:4Fe-4S binding protein [Waterburya agarophytonicola K14]|uniref:4Fe-4S binding protein n=1 Tax=Waterburya agarophytonicola KI4 TaxID=2874699 RepID=A0A964BRV6_9CYAN|nr:4Fe-4S binding protein [Waterburya agarophytonicola]MCC0177398.1 4Fe-4S binding protein [Waterburya agarophytonicola KI4]
MLNKVAEQKAHTIRYVLVVGWILLIVSLFFDPISAHLTDPNTTFFSPLKDDLLIRAANPETCIRLQGECIKDGDIPYKAGARIFWGYIVPAGFGIVFVLGHEFWRRICPLYFLSQIPRALGLKPKKKISENKWLTENHLYLQFVLFFIGLNMRILFINSARPVFGGFLVFTIGAAIIMNLFYGGRSWCHYVCPFGMVQMALTGPRGLLGSEAQKEPPKTITQSMCRTFDQETGKEKATCISCKSPCMDIDSEKAYWEQLTKPGRKLVQYGYLGLVCGYFLYYFLYSGNFDYYFSGSWTHEKGQVAKIFNPGFFIGGQAIPIPKFVATPLTLAAMAGIVFLIVTQIEKIYTGIVKKQNPNLDRKIIIHRVFTIVTFLAVNCFYVYGGRPELLRLPFVVNMIFNGLVVLISTLWLVRTWGRTNEQYKKESIADKLRRQLKKLSIDFTSVLGGRTLDDLKADELDLLAQVVPQVTKQDRIQVYKGVLEESLASGNVEATNSLKSLESVRQRLEVTEEEHYAMLSEIGIDDPTLINAEEYSREERFRIESYKESIAGILQELVDSGMPVGEAVSARTNQIANLKNEYNINSEEHLQVLSGLFDSLRPKAEKLLALLQTENSRYQVISNFQPYSSTPVFMLLRKLLLAKQQLIVRPLLAVLELLNDEPDAVHLAQRTGVVATDAISQVLTAEPQWQQRLNPNILREIMPGGISSTQETVVKAGGTKTILHSESRSAQAVDDTLLELLQEPNPITESASLYALTQLNRDKGIAQAQQIMQQPLQNDLVKGTAASILGQAPGTSVIEQLLTMSGQSHFQTMTPDQLLSLVTQAQQNNRDITEITPPGG